MINDILLFGSIFTALLILMIDYGLGFPADDKTGYGSFLFSYSLFLATRRYKKSPQYSMYYGQYIEQLNNTDDILEKHRIRRNFEELVFTSGNQLFTWEKAFGMCPFCTHFWITVITFFLIFIFGPNENIIIFTFYLTFSHAILRFLKKYF